MRRGILPVALLLVLSLLPVQAQAASSSSEAAPHGLVEGASASVVAARAAGGGIAGVDGLSLIAGLFDVSAVPVARIGDSRLAGPRRVGAGLAGARSAADAIAGSLAWVAALLFYPAVAWVTVSIDPGQVTTFADDPGSVADVVVVGGYAYVASSTAIWKIDTSTASASVFAGSASTAGCVDDSDPDVARFNALAAVTSDGSSLFVVDDCPDGGQFAPNAVREVVLSTGATSTVVSMSESLVDVVYAPDDYLYVVADPRDVFQVDPSTGSTSLFVTHPLNDETLGPSSDLAAITADSDALYVVAPGFSFSDPDHINAIDLGDGSISRVAEVGYTLGSNLESAGDYLYATTNYAPSTTVNDLRVVRVAKTDGSVVAVAGSGSVGEVDGVEAEAWFGTIGGLASDGTALWVADGGVNSSLRKVVDAPAVARTLAPELDVTVAIDRGRVTTIAGDGTAATTDGTGTSASFNNPSGMVVVGDTAYIAQTDAIRAMDLATGAVTTFAGVPGTTGCNDSTDPEQTTFYIAKPSRLATDGTYLYTVDYCLGFFQPLTLRRTSLATGATSRVVDVFRDVRGITLGPDGMLYLATGSAARIDRVDPATGTLVEDAVVAGHYSGINTWVEGIGADADGLWVMAHPASGTEHIDFVDLDTDTVTQLVAFTYFGDRVVSAGDFLYVTAGDNYAVLRVSKSDGSWVHVAGAGGPLYYQGGYVDGLGDDARFQRMGALTTDGRRILVADTTNHRIRAVAEDGFFAYGAGAFGYDGYGAWFGGVNTGLGSYTTSATDVAVTTMGPGLEVTRTYNSADPSGGAFGDGWTFSYDITWVQDDVGNIGVLFPDGRREVHLKNGSSYEAPDGYDSVLTGSPATGFTLELKDGTEIDLGADGTITAMSDRNGHELTFSYDASGNLETATAESGRTLDFTWSGGHITQVETDSVTAHSGPLSWKYYYSGDLLTEVCDPRDNTQTGSCVEYTYTLGRLTEIRRPEGNRQVGITYRADGRVQSTIDGLGNSTGYSYPELGTVEVTDARNNTWTQEYDDQFRLVSETDPADGETTYTYDTAGYRETITDALNHTSTLDYDSNGNVSSVTNPENETEYFTYNASNDLLTSRDGRSSGPTDDTYKTAFTYDASGNRTSETDPLGNKTTWTYTDGTETAVGGGTMPAGLTETMVTPRGNEQGATPADYTTTYAYDSAGNLRTVDEPSGLQTAYTYDELGRTLTEAVTDSVAGTTATTTYTYDVMGNVLTVTGPGIENPVSEVTHQQRVTNTYDANNRLTQSVVSDLQGGDTSRTTTFGYDLNDREISVTDPEGGVLSRDYDAVGNVVEVTDQEGRVVTTVYDSRNLPTKVTAEDFVDDPVAGSTPRDVTLAQMAYDAAGRKTTETDAEGRQRTWVYDHADRVLSVTLEDYQNSDQTTRDIVLEAYTYDDAGNVLTETTGGGLRLVTNTYDAASRRATSTLEMGAVDRVTTFTYDANSNVTKVTLSDGTRTEEQRFTFDYADRMLTRSVENGATDLTTTFAYDERGNQRSLTDPESNTTTTTFDAANRPTVMTLPQVDVEEGGATPTATQPTVTTGYNTFGDPTHLEDARGEVTIQSFDRLSRRTRVDHPDYVDPDSTTVSAYETFTFDDVGNLIAQRSRRGHTTNFTFDNLNRVVQQLDPLLTGESTRGSIRFEYDDVGNRTAVVDQRGARIEWAYDDLDRARTMTQVVRQPSGPDAEYVTGYGYDDLGNQTSVTDPESNTTTFTYSAASELLTVTDPLSKTTSYAYDVAGRQTRVTDPLGRYITSTYDLAGRRTTQGHYDSSDTLEAEYEWTYDGNGNTLTAESARGYVTSYSYNALSWLTQVVVPIDATTSITTSYGYDAAGNVTRFTDGEANKTIYTYQEWGLQEDVIEPSTTQHTVLADRTWTTVYDAGGLAVEERQPGGVTISRTFDQLGRLTQESGSGTGVTSATRSFGYDKAGLRTSIAHPDGTIGFAYDDRGLMIDTDHPGGTTGDATFSYDDAGRLTQRVDEAGTTTFTWTARNELDTLADPVTGITLDWAWDDASQPTTITYGTTSPPVRSLTWDDLGRLDTDVLKDSSQTVLVDYDYGYDADGNVTSVDVDLGGNSLDGTHTYTYDRAGRITGWTDPNTTTTSYTWDDAGNRTGAGNDSFTYDARNRLVTSPDGDLTYDARGTVNDIDGTTYDFDALGRLLTVGTVDFTYDSLDRIATREATDFTYTGQMMDPTTDGTNTWTRTPAGRLIAQDDGTNDRLIGLNRHGDQSWLFGTTGTVSATTVYDPFGVAAATTGGGGSPLGFQGDYTDPTFGEVWMGARWYSASDAGFRSRDGVFGELTTPVSLNRYTYALNNPLVYWDPTGRYSEYIEGLDGPRLGGGLQKVNEVAGRRTKQGAEDHRAVARRAAAASPVQMRAAQTQTAFDELREAVVVAAWRDRQVFHQEQARAASCADFHDTALSRPYPPSRLDFFGAGCGDSGTIDEMEALANLLRGFADSPANLIEGTAEAITYGGSLQVYNSRLFTSWIRGDDTDVAPPTMPDYDFIPKFGPTADEYQGFYVAGDVVGEVVVSVFAARLLPGRGASATNTADDLLALPGRQVDAVWGVNTYRHGGTMTTIEHINYRHAWDSGFSNVSRFAEGTSARQIRDLVDEALRYGTVSENGTSVLWDAGRALGVDAAGNTATGLQVYIRGGVIQTAFPVGVP